MGEMLGTNLTGGCVTALTFDKNFFSHVGAAQYEVAKARGSAHPQFALTL